MHVHFARATLLVVTGTAGEGGTPFREFWLASDASDTNEGDLLDLSSEGLPRRHGGAREDWVEAAPRGDDALATPYATDRVLVTDGPVAELLAQEFLRGFEGWDGLLARQRELDALRAGEDAARWPVERIAAIRDGQAALNAAVRKARFAWPVVLTVLDPRFAALLARDLATLALADARMETPLRAGRP